MDLAIIGVRVVFWAFLMGVVFTTPLGCGERLDGCGLPHPVDILKIKARGCGQMCVVRG